MARLEQRHDVGVVLDVGHAHAHDARQRVHDNLIVQRVRLVLRAGPPRSAMS